MKNLNNRVLRKHSRKLKVLGFTLTAVWILYRHLKNFTSNSALTHADLKVLQGSSYSLSLGKSQRKVVLIAPTTHHYKSFLANLQCSVRRHTGKDAVVIAFDKKIEKWAKKKRYSVIGPLRLVHWGSDDAATPHTFRSSSFRSITKLKLMAVREILVAGYDVILTDIDIVWCDNAIRLLSELIQQEVLGDVLMQSDGCRYDKRWIRLNTGFYYAKSTPQVIALFDEVISFASKPENSHLDDQKSFIRVACNGMKISWEDLGENNLDICKWNDIVHVRALPIEKYVNGAVFMNRTRVYNLPTGALNHMCSTKQIVIWHNNWCPADQKLQRFQRHDMWLLDDNTGECKAKSVDR